MSGNAKTPEPMKPKDYAAFIEGIELKDVRLLSLRADIKDNCAGPASCLIATTAKASYEVQESGFTASHSYIVTIKHPETKSVVARLAAVFAVSFVSKVPIDDNIFSVFESRNLPVNTWPYLRELAHNTFARMNLHQVVAPTFKSGVSREQTTKSHR